MPFASSIGYVNRTSHPCGSSENGTTVFVQIALLFQKHLSTALRPIDGQICGYRRVDSNPLWLGLQTIHLNKQLVNTARPISSDDLLSNLFTGSRSMTKPYVKQRSTENTSPVFSI